MKIAVITTSRADWNALGMVAKALRHLGEGVKIVAVEGHLGTDAIGADGFGPAIRLTRPEGDDLPFNGIDMAVLLGDRWETLYAAVKYATAGIPIAHIAGGDITEGSDDNTYRHAITKLSQLHFPTHEEARKRIIQMGEQPERVFNYGSASVDRIRSTPLMSAEEVSELFAEGKRPLVLVNWQPVTLGNDGGLSGMLYALSRMDAAFVCISAGNDPGGEEINNALKAWVAKRECALYAVNLPPATYLSVMKYCDFMIGNSSSALYEAPILGTHAIDVGDRQKGRYRPGNVIHSHPDAAAIALTITNAWRAPQKPRAARADAIAHPYGDGHAAEKIAATIASMGMIGPYGLRQKKFHVVA